MVRKHSRDEILAAALDVAVEHGLSALSFGRVAKRVGTSDRMIVYYFATKDELVGNVILAMGAELQTTLAEAFTDVVDGHLALVRAAWPVLCAPESDRVFALFFEANGLATAGREPYTSLVPQLVTAWVEWAAEFISGDTDSAREEAEAAIVLVDGLILLRLLRGPEAADRAAVRLGVAD